MRPGLCVLPALLLLGGCEGAAEQIKSEGKAQAKRAIATAQDIAAHIAAWVDMSRDDRPLIDCAWQAGAELAPVCKAERLEERDGRDMLLMVSRPDGGLRRLRVSTDGRVAAADGADPLEVTHLGGDLLIVIGEERYRFLPARLEAIR